MPSRNPDLHGSAPDKSEIALLLIDVINDLNFPEANQLLRYARPMARKLLRLKQRAKKAGIPVMASRIFTEAVLNVSSKRDASSLCRARF